MIQQAAAPTEGGWHWRVSEAMTPHETYCGGQAAWRGPFASDALAIANAKEAGYEAFQIEVENALTGERL